MRRIHRTARQAGAFALAATLALAACSSDPSLPPVEDEAFPEPERTQDWEAWGEDRPDEPPTREGAPGQRVQVIGTLLSSDEIRRALSGQTLRGCYPNGEKFAERLDADGRFFDAATNEQLGTWFVDDEALCFRYPQQGDQCFPVSREGSDLFFYRRDFSGIVAATRCS